jgi:hypoxanthine phosphoribosyltransferase
MKLYISYDQVIEQCKILATQLKEQKPDLIVGIARGGLVPAVHLSHMLDLPMDTVLWQTRDGGFKEYNKRISEQIRLRKTVVFIDDINDTGTTFTKLNKFYGNALYVALLERPESAFKCDYAGQILTDPSWCVFPWEENKGDK